MNNDIKLEKAYGEEVENIYNAHETWLYYRANPGGSISNDKNPKLVI